MVNSTIDTQRLRVIMITIIEFLFIVHYLFTVDSITDKLIYFSITMSRLTFTTIVVVNYCGTAAGCKLFNIKFLCIRFSEHIYIAYSTNYYVCKKIICSLFVD